MSTHPLYLFIFIPLLTSFLFSFILFHSPFIPSIPFHSLLIPSIPFLSLLFSSLPQLLNKDPKKRISIEDAFAHPFLQQANSELTSPKAEASLEVVSGQCNTIQYKTIQYNTIQYNTIQYNTIQYNTRKISISVPLHPSLICSFFLSNVRLADYLPVYLSVFDLLSTCLCLSVCLSSCLSSCLSVCVSVSLSVCLSVCLHARLSVCLSVCLSYCLSVDIFVCLSVCLYVCVRLSVSVNVCLPVYLCVCLNFTWRQESIPIINLIFFPISLDLSFSIPLSPLLSCLQMSSLGRFMRLSRFKKLMLEAVAFSLTPAQITILRAEFNAMDTDRYIHSSVHRRFPNVISVAAITSIYCDFCYCDNMYQF